MIKKRFWPLFYTIILLFLACIVTARNLGFTKYFLGEDSGLSFSFPNTLFESTYYMWDSLTAPGKMNITSTFGFLWSNIVLLFFNLGLNDIHIKRIMYSLFFFISGSGMFFLLNILLHIYASKIQKNIAYFAAFTGSLLYMFNPFTIHMANLPIIPYHSSYMVLPLVLGLFIYNLQIHSSLFSTILFSLSSFFLISANPSNTISIGAFYIFYLLIFLKEIRLGRVKVKFFIIISTIIVILLTSYIYLPAIFSQANPYGDLGSFTNYLLSLNLNSSFTSFANLLRLTGGITWPTFPFYYLYIQNPILIIIGFTIPLLVLASFLFTGHKKIKIFFGIVAIGSLFFAKGSHPPFEDIFLFLYKTIPFFGMFRAVYYKFAFFTVVAYAVLLSFTTIYLYQYLKNRFQKHSFFVFIIPLIICLYGWPFFVGIVPKQDYLTSIPNDYKELRNSLSSDVTDSKVLALPPAPKGSGLLLQWNNGDKYAGPHPDAYLIDKPVIDSYWFTRVGYKDLIADDSWTGKKFEDNFAETLRYLGILNIRYLFVHNDFVENYDFGNKDVRKIEGRLKAKRLESLISKYPDIIVMKQTPYFMLYKLPDRLFLPHFYIPETLIYSTDQIRELFNSEQKMGKYAILPSKQINNKTDFDKDNSPTIRFTRVNPTKYKVRIKQAIKPFYLIFSESFDNNWKLYINNSNLDDTIKDSKHLSALFNQNIFETWGKTPINDKNHMKANGYANAWFIQPDNRQNNHEYEVIVEYKPQQYFYLGLIISIITLIGSSVYIFYHILKKENV